MKNDEEWKSHYEKLLNVEFMWDSDSSWPGTKNRSTYLGLIQNHSNCLLWEKTKYLTWHFIRLDFMKITSMSTLKKALDISNATVWVNPDPLKAPAILSNCWIICRWTRRPETILEIGKKAIFVMVVVVCKIIRDLSTIWKTIFFRHKLKNLASMCESVG